MKYLYLLVTLTFLTPLFSSAQSNYKPGYVVTLKGDTLKGYIDYKEWIQNPSAINFAPDADAPPSVYNFNNCAAFGVDGFEYYRKYTTSISQDNVQVANLTVGLNTKTLVKAVFLKVLASGKNVTLFTYNDGIKRRFFTAETNEPAIELIHSLYLDPEDNSRIVTLNSYMRQLQQLAAKYQPENAKLIKEAAAVEYDEKDLKQLIYAINGNSTNLILKSADQFGIRLFAGVGINNNHTSFYDGATSKSSSLYPEVSIGTDLFINKDVGSLIVRLQLGFTGAKASTTSTGMDANSSTATTLKYDQFVVFFNPQVLYNFYNTNSTKIYVTIGGQLNYASYSNKSYTTSYTLSGGYTQISDNDFPGVEPFYLNLTSKVGIVINNKLDINIGYNPSTRINGDEGFNLSESSFKAGINYLFGKN